MTGLSDRGQALARQVTGHPVGSNPVDLTAASASKDPNAIEPTDWPGDAMANCHVMGPADRRSRTPSASAGHGDSRGH